MLVLTRKIGTSIIIEYDNKKIVVTVLDVKGGQIKIGIDAPEDIPVYRDEIYDRVKCQKQQHR